MTVVSKRLISPRNPNPALPAMLPSPIEEAIKAASCLVIPRATATSGRNRKGTRNGNIIIAHDDAKATYPILTKENKNLRVTSEETFSLSLSLMSTSEIIVVNCFNSFGPTDQDRYFYKQ